MENSKRSAGPKIGKYKEEFERDQSKDWKSNEWRKWRSSSKNSRHSSNDDHLKGPSNDNSVEREHKNSWALTKDQVGEKWKSLDAKKWALSPSNDLYNDPHKSDKNA